MASVKLNDLRSIRKALNRSQSQLAELLGVSLRAVQSYEQGWRPTPPHIHKLAGFLLFLKGRKTNGKSTRCWTVNNCAPQKRDACPAYQFNAGDFCWIVTGNYWKGKLQKSWQVKLAKCMKCPVTKEWLNV